MTSEFKILPKDVVLSLKDRFQKATRRRAETAIMRAGLGDKGHVELIDAVTELLGAIKSQRTGDDIEQILANKKTAEEIREKSRAIHSLRHGFQSGQLAEVAKAAGERQDPERVKSVFGDEERLYLKGPAEIESTAKTEIAKALLDKGYSILDYREGKATDSRQKQQYKIGKLLADTPDLLKKFMDDPARTQDKLMVVVSRNAEDIARMSTNREWTSCMNAKDGERWSFVPEAVRQGALVAYLVSENDVDINSPLARVTIVPFQDKKGRTVYGVEKPYGLVNDAFLETINAFVERELNAEPVEGRFHIRQGVYNDLLPPTIYRRNDLLGEVMKPNGAMDKGKVLSLIAEGKGFDERDEDGARVIHHAAKNDRTELIDLLAEKGAGINAMAYNGETALHYAAKGGRCKAVKSLLDRGADINAASKVTKKTPLHLAIEYDHEALAIDLLEKGADSNARNTAGETSLHLAAGKNLPLVVKALIRHGAMVDAVDCKGWTPLFRAVFSELDDMAILLLDNGADPTKKTTNGRSPLDCAKLFVRPETAERMNAEAQNRRRTVWSSLAQRLGRFF